jgi:hypothetical protein
MIIDDGADRVTWHDFAGGAANTLLARLLEREVGGRVVSRNTSLTFTGVGAVLGKLGIAIENVCDTRALSRKRYGPLAGGHSLLAAVRRELDVTIDKRCQTSDWTPRPLSSDQERYAALDVELLLGLRDALAARELSGCSG